MAYFSQEGAMHGWNGQNGYIPAAPITRKLCDTCATIEVPFHPVGTIPRQMKPWKWAPYFGAHCDRCSKPC